MLIIMQPNILLIINFFIFYFIYHLKDYFEISETGETCNNTDCATTCANNDTIYKSY